MEQSVVLPQRRVIIMGKDIGFHMVSRKSGGDSKSENQVSHPAII